VPVMMARWTGLGAGLHCMPGVKFSLSHRIMPALGNHKKPQTPRINLLNKSEPVKLMCITTLPGRACTRN